MSDDGEPRASSEVIAAGVKQQHASVLKLVRRHIEAFKQFGLVRFEIRARQAGRHGGGQVEYAMLNEQQASLLLAFMRNSDLVIEFKIALIKEFFRMRGALERRDATMWRKRQELELRDAESLVRASFGSRLMLERKRDLVDIDAERAALDLAMNPPLFLN
jgi:phage regulator Rha-like protein